MLLPIGSEVVILSIPGRADCAYVGRQGRVTDYLTGGGYWVQFTELRPGEMQPVTMAYMEMRVGLAATIPRIARERMVDP